jgi:cytochrome c-type biogenesis protein CcmH
MSSFWSLSLFWIFVLVMIGLGLAFVLPPLFRKQTKARPLDREAINVSIYRDQLAELEADLKAGLLPQAQYETTRLEIEQRLAQDVPPNTQTQTASRGARWVAFAVAAVLPVAAVGLYAAIGNPEALFVKPVQPDEAQGEGHDLQAMLASLEKRLKDNPNDTNGWLLLGRTYSAMERYGDALSAFAKAAELSPEDARAWSAYAEAMAITQGRNLAGKPMELVNKALSLNPKDEKALELAGIAAFQEKNFAQAAFYWKQLLQLIPGETEYARDIGNAMQEAQRLASEASGLRTPALDNLAQSPAGQGATRADSVTGSVSLSPGLAAKASPSDTVFIFARAVQGPKMPLAIRKVQVKDLPYRFSLDDSMAMTPSAKLSDFAQVVIGARISKSGVAQPSSGDLQGLSGPLKVGATDVKLVIDTVLP